jgi:hypothetical protein
MRGELAPSPPNTGVSHISPPLPNDVPYSSHRQWVGHSLGLLHQFAIPDFALFNSHPKKTAMRGGGVGAARLPIRLGSAIRWDCCTSSQSLTSLYSTPLQRKLLCEGGELNPHALRHWILSPARLPVPPPSLIITVIILAWIDANALFCIVKSVCLRLLRRYAPRNGKGRGLLFYSGGCLPPVIFPDKPYLYVPVFQIGSTLCGCIHGGCISLYFCLALRGPAAP